MMAFITNPWFIGIFGGLLSGLAVTLITRYIFRRREYREYNRILETANNEIMYSLRPSIAEKMFPSKEIIESVISATANKYIVEVDDLYDLKTLSDDIIKDIMDNTFLSSQQKNEFCDHVTKLRNVLEHLPK